MRVVVKAKPNAIFTVQAPTRLILQCGPCVWAILSMFHELILRNTGHKVPTYPFAGEFWELRTVA
jgi:hypothetical protein